MNGSHSNISNEFILSGLLFESSYINENLGEKIVSKYKKCCMEMKIKCSGFNTQKTYMKRNQKTNFSLQFQSNCMYLILIPSECIRISMLFIALL